MEKESQKTISELEDLSHLAREKARADADYYSKQRQAEGHHLLLTKEFLELKRIEAIASNNKIFYGPSIPSVFLADPQQAFTVKHPEVTKTKG